MTNNYDYSYTPLWNSNRRSDENQIVWCFWRRRRNLVAVLAFFGFFNIYALRVNLSVAVVAMTTPVRTVLDNGTITYIPEFDWNSQTKGLVLSSFFYGYIVTQLPGSWLANKIGGNRVFALGIGATSLLTLLTPSLARASTARLVTLRVIEGLFEGVSYPSMHAVWARWAPRGERARLAATAFGGSYAGSLVAVPASALLATYAGWNYIFYVSGAGGAAWTAAWLRCVAESPETDPHITATELQYIQSTREMDVKTSTKMSYPWKAMLSSGPVWAIVVAHFCENWGFYTLMTFLPTFIQDVYKFDVAKTGWVSALPYLAMTVSLQVSGHLADWLLSRGTFSRTTIRRLFTCGAFLAQTIFMSAAAYSTTAGASVAALTAAVGLGGFAWAGFGVNHLDVAPPLAGLLMALSNTAGSLPGVLGPAYAGALLTDRSVGQWRKVFLTSSGIYLVGAAVYGALCSAERQPWAADRALADAETDSSRH